MTAVATVALIPPPSPRAYAGSESCAGCHPDAYALMKHSRHQMMMRPASQNDVVVANFETTDPGLRFRKSDAVWAIGGKWEQQFMGTDGATETLLPGSWHVAQQDWDFRGWDGWQRPEPLERCHGCHTVGLNVATGEFVEPNIGCESCHGPSEWHVTTWGIGQVYSGVESEVCGQCHSRGNDPTRQYFFPVDYEPGGATPLNEAFELLKHTPGQDSSHWWGDGHARQRHQEYPAWMGGGHAKALKSLREDYDGRFGPATDDCLPCHSADYILAGRNKPSLEEASNGITCAVCHNTHGDLDALRVDCASCHGDGPSFHNPQTLEAHVPAPVSAHSDCLDCHMPRTGIIGGESVLHSHSPGVVPPQESARAVGRVTSCSNSECHVGDSVSLLSRSFENTYRFDRDLQRVDATSGATRGPGVHRAPRADTGV